jgi:DNA-binding transcriptional MocR family regulator
MARRRYAAPLAMDLFRPLEREGAALLSDQLEERVRQLLAGGRLKPGDYLPPLRFLARKLGVSVGTVAKAYATLGREGVAAGDSTRGLRVTSVTPLPPRSRRPWASTVMRPTLPVDPLGGELPRPASSSPIRFHTSEPGTDLLPTALVARAFGAALADGANLRYPPIGGLPETRAAVDSYLGRRGIALAGAEVLLTAGTTQSLAIITRALLPPGGVVLTEHPTWYMALAVFAAAGARVVALPVDDEGLEVGALAEAVLRCNPAFLYLQPAFQNPTGVSLSPERRADLLAVARRLQLLVIEDDYAAELAFRESPRPLRTAECAEVVIYVKSFAKVLAPSLRIGAIVAPARYAAALKSALHGLDPYVSTVAQRALAACLSAPAFSAHLKALTAALARRARALDEALQAHMPPGARWTRPAGGLCAWVELPPRVRSDEFAREAARRGVLLAPGRLFCLDDSGERGLRIAFAVAKPPEIERGVGVLGDLLRARVRRGRRPAAVPRSVAP